MPQQIKIPTVVMRGGTSRGVFFRGDALPPDPELRDRILLRVLGSPDPYKKQIDGLGGATSSTSKAVIVSPSKHPDCDVDYLFGQVGIDKPFIDWSGNCGNLTSAVGPFAIEEGMVKPVEGITIVRIWQANIGKRIIAHIPVQGGVPESDGECVIDGVPGASAEIRLEFLDPGGAGGGRMLPTGNVVDTLTITGCSPIEATLISAGNPTIFVSAQALGLSGTELPDAVDTKQKLLERLESLRALGAVAMGLAATPLEATQKRPGSPRIAFISPPRTYETSRGEMVSADSIDVCARILSMGKLHHAFTGTGAVALACAAALPGSIVNRAAGFGDSGNTDCRIGHTAGTLHAGAHVMQENGEWKAEKAIMIRTARRLMEGSALIPASVFE